MNKQTIIITVLSLYFLPLVQAQTKSADNMGVPTIAITKLDLSGKALELNYQVKNGSKHDIWICHDVDVRNEWDYESFLDEDSQILVIRKRLDVRANLESYRQRIGMYARLRSGEERTVTLSLTIPVHPCNVYEAGRVAKGLEQAKGLDVEIGYYIGDLPGIVRGILEKTETINDGHPDKNLVMIKRYLGDIPYFFNDLNKNVDLTEKILIPYNWQALKNEHVLRITVDGVLIPYEEEWPKPLPPDLSSCTRVEIRYEPSMLEYFFPNAGQQSLLSSPEKEYLQSLKVVTVTDQEHLKALASEVGSLSFIGTKGGTITTPRMAHVTCFRDDKRLTLFSVYVTEWSGAFIRANEMHRFSCTSGLRSLEIITSQIKPFELRVKCADKLQTLWTRLHSFYRNKRSYPGSKWGDTSVRAFLSRGFSNEYILGLFKCPSAILGKCHYAINPNCRPDSPPEMVLLFETKAGWNQHGGPEFFTFDNHDPKGGCVLLNDGTVKFIRTKEELQQLHWK